MPPKENHLVVYMGLKDGEWVNMSASDVKLLADDEDISSALIFKEPIFDGEIVINDKDIWKLWRILFNNNCRRMHGMKPKRFRAFRKWWLNEIHSRKPL